MLTEFLLIAAAGIIDPMDMSGHQMYPSGVKECDKYPRFPYPTSKLAKLSVGHRIVSADGSIIKGGHYLVSLSISKNEILFFEGEKAIYTLNVSSLEVMDKPVRISTAEFVSDDNGQCFILLKQGRYLVTSYVNIDDNIR